MDMFTFAQRPTEQLFHDYDVFEFVFGADTV